MALTKTTLSGAVTANATFIKVTAATGFAAGQVIRVDNEFMRQIGDANGLYINVRRGEQGSAVVAHGTLADCVTGLAADFPDPGVGNELQVMPSDYDRVTISTDSTVDSSVYGKNTTIVINKGSATAITLLDPLKSQDGLRLTFRSSSAFAHTVDYTAGFYGDTSSSNLATFAAKNGASFTCEANGGSWGVIAAANVTFA